MIFVCLQSNAIDLQGSANDKMQSSVPDCLFKAKPGEKLEKVWGNSRPYAAESYRFAGKPPN
jgi:hypothetical protein